MKDFILFGKEGASGQRRPTNISNRHCAVSSGATISTLADNTTSSSVSWSQPSLPRQDFGRFVDGGAPGGLYAREEGYYFHVVNVQVVFASASTTGYMIGTISNSFDATEISRVEMVTDGVSKVCFDMMAGDWFEAGGYAYVQFENQTGVNVDVYTRAFSMKVG